MTDVLSTPRLVLRPFVPADGPAMFRVWAADERVTRYLRWTPHKDEAESLALARQWAADRQAHQWAIVRGCDGQLMGSIGVVPADSSHPRYQVMLDAAGEAARYAAERGAVIAVETGPEPLKTLRGFVDACGKGMGINFDPANLVMVGADDEVSAVADAGSAIVHTHAKDGRSLSPILPEEFYHKFAEDGLDWILSNPCYEETPLGQGSVRWIPYLRALQSVGYNGFLTIEREAKNGAEDIRMAVRFLRETIAAL